MAKSRLSRLFPNDFFACLCLVGSIAFLVIWFVAFSPGTHQLPHYHARFTETTQLHFNVGSGWGTPCPESRGWGFWTQPHWKNISDSFVSHSRVLHTIFLVGAAGRLCPCTSWGIQYHYSVSPTVWKLEYFIPHWGENYEKQNIFSAKFGKVSALHY